MAARRMRSIASAINSPKLLMLSGIGPAEQLRKHGIEVVADRSGVGQNLQDHPIVPVRFLAAKPVSLLTARSAGSVFRYLVWGRGMLAGSGVDALAHVRTRRDAAAPDLQLCLMAVLWTGQGLVEPKEAYMKAVSKSEMKVALERAGFKFELPAAAAVLT